LSRSVLALREFLVHCVLYTVSHKNVPLNLSMSLPNVDRFKKNSPVHSEDNLQ